MLEYAEKLTIEMKEELNMWNLQNLLQEAVERSDFLVNVGENDGLEV